MSAVDSSKPGPASDEPFAPRHIHIDAGGAALRPLIQRINQGGVDEVVLGAVMRNVVEMSTHWLGSYVVEACILRAPPHEDRWLLVHAFAVQYDHDLAELVQDEYGSCVLQKLLKSCKDEFPEEASELARRIHELPDAVLEHTNANRVVGAIRKMFPRRRR